MVEYKYDAWGRATYASDQLPISNWLCLLNPFRYRGYIYDSETGMYYLRSRYYNPEIGRFLNADALVLEKLLAANVFSYCLNRPTVKIDKSGESAIAIGIGAWLASGSWVAVASIAKAAGIFLLKTVGIGAVAGLAAVGVNQITHSISNSNVDERTDVQPAPGPAPTTAPRTSPAPRATLGPSVNPDRPDYPGDDPKVPPEGYEWRGKGPQGSPQGNYFNPETGESLHPDLDHKPPIGPHWDYWGPDGIKIRIFPPNIGG